MVPEVKVNNFEINNNTVGKTYTLDIENKRIYGKIDGLESVKQAVYKILQTERQAYVIYNDEYGIELERFFGLDIDFVKSDLERTIREALTNDIRVNDIKDFSILEVELDTIHIEFTVESIYGEIYLKSEVKI